MRLLALVALAAMSSGAGATAPPSKESSQSRASEGATEQVVNVRNDETVICRRDKTIGSRIRTERICLTRQQWAERLHEERMKIEQGQAQRTYTDHGGL